MYYLYIVLNISCFYPLLGTYQLVSKHKGMATNHERIESLEVDVYDVKKAFNAQRKEQLAQLIACKELKKP